jgi:AsmA protein
MRRRSIVALGAVAAVLALAAVPFLVPLDTYRAPIERAATAALGRDVHIRGAIHLSIYPQIGISLGKVSIAGAPGARNPEMVEVDSAVVGAKLMPLFSRRLEVTEVVLKRPVIRLEVAKDGKGNWQLSSRDPARPNETSRAVTQIGVARLRVEDGEVSYYDAESDKTQTISNVSITLGMPMVRTQARVIVPLSFSGQLTYNGETLKLSGGVDNFDAFMRGQGSTARISVASNIINADFSGTLGAGGNLSGALKLGAHSVRSLANWVGHPLPRGNGFGLLALEGQIVANDGVYTLRQTHLAFDSMSLNANLIIDTKPDILGIKGTATLDRLDLHPYLAPGQADDTVEAAKARAANPDAPLALGGLKAANADLTLVVGALLLPSFKIDHALVNVALHDGVLKADLSKLAVYGGTGKGSLTVDATGDTPSIHSTLDLDDLKVQPFLDELMGVKNVTGLGAVRFDVQARGKTSKEIVKALSGKGSVKFTDGNVTGVDLAAVARVMQSVLTTEVLSGAVGDNAKTPFGQMGGSFTVQNGVLHTTDLKLVNDVVEMSGRGDVDFSTHALEFHLEPVAKRGIPGLKLVDVGIPFYVKGPWNKPSYGPDARALAKTLVNKPVDVLRNPGEALKSLFGR